MEFSSGGCNLVHVCSSVGPGGCGTLSFVFLSRCSRCWLCGVVCFCLSLLAIRTVPVSWSRCGGNALWAAVIYLEALFSKPVLKLLRCDFSCQVGKFGRLMRSGAECWGFNFSSTIVSRMPSTVFRMRQYGARKHTVRIAAVVSVVVGSRLGKKNTQQQYHGCRSFFHQFTVLKLFQSPAQNFVTNHVLFSEVAMDSRAGRLCVTLYTVVSCLEAQSCSNMFPEQLANMSQLRFPHGKSHRFVHEHKGRMRAMVASTTADVEPLKRHVRFMLKIPLRTQSFSSRKSYFGVVGSGDQDIRTVSKRMSFDMAGHWCECNSVEAEVKVNDAETNTFQQIEPLRWNRSQVHRHCCTSTCAPATFRWKKTASQNSQCMVWQHNPDIGPRSGLQHDHKRNRRSFSAAVKCSLHRL